MLEVRVAYVRGSSHCRTRTSALAHRLASTLVAAPTVATMRTLAVATSVHTVDELEAHSPWATIPALPDPAAFRRLVGLPVGDVARLP